MNYARRVQEEFLRGFHCKRSGFSCQVFKHHLSCRNVEDLASKLGVPPATLTRMFDDEFGVSPLKCFSSSAPAMYTRIWSIATYH